MRIQPKSNKRRRIRVRQVQLAEYLKGVRRYLRRIRNEAVSDFERVHIGGVFLYAAEPVDGRRRKKQQNLQKQQKHRKRRPIFRPQNLPIVTPPIKRPMQSAKQQIEREQKRRRSGHEALDDMPQNIMAEFMANDEERFLIRRLLNERVPNHYALRSPQPGDVGIDGVGFPAGFLKEHPLRRNGDPGALRELLNGSDQVRMLPAERLELIEEGIDHQRHDHNDHEQNRHRGKPEKQPPAPRAEAHDREQDEHQDGSNNQADQLLLGPVPEPGAPALYLLLVMQRKPVPIQAHRQVQHVNQEKQQRHEDQSLHPAVLAGAFRDIPKARRDSQPEDQEEENASQNVGKKIEGIAGAGISHRFFIFFVRESVLFRACLFRSADDQRRSLVRRRQWRGGLRGTALCGRRRLRSRRSGQE